MIDITKSLGETVVIPIGEIIINLSIHEYNAGDLIIEKNLPLQFIPQSNNYATKTIWFCEEIVKRGIKLYKIYRVEQLGDIFTKGLTRVAFGYLWKKLMAW